MLEFVYLVMHLVLFAFLGVLAYILWQGGMEFAAGFAASSALFHVAYRAKHGDWWGD